MIVSWMLYSLLSAFLLAAGAKALERALRVAGGPGRWAWAAALAGAVLVPAVSLVLAARAPDPVTVGLGPVTPIAAPASLAVAGVTEGLLDVVGPFLAGLEAPLLRLWALASVGLLILFGGSALRLGRFRRGWSERMLDGDAVFVSREVGPAVVGLLRPRIVVPRWVVDRGPEARSLILSHEREHCRARDPLLVFLGALPVVLMPWNAPLWWGLSRLRLAVELDCDQRVLRSATPGARRRYGELLVEVGRRPAGPVRARAAFSERRSGLERRVRALTERRPDRRLPQVAGFGALGLLAAVAACVVPSPDAPSSVLEPDASEPPVTVERPGPVAEAPGDPVLTPYTDPPQIQNGREVQRALGREYPALVRDAGIGGVVELWLRLDEEGRVVDARLDESSGLEVLDAAALRVAEVMRFSPARNEGEAVAVWIRVPLRFETGGADGTRLPEQDRSRWFDLVGERRFGDALESLRTLLVQRGESGVGLVIGLATELLRVEPPEAEAPSAVDAPPEPGPGEPPPPPAEGPPAEPTVAEGPVLTPYTSPPQVTNSDEVKRALVEAYPPLLRDAGIGGIVQVWFFIGEDGRVRDTRLHQASGSEALDEAALRVAEVIAFTPATNGGEAVPVWISLPIRFDVP